MDFSQRKGMHCAGVEHWHLKSRNLSCLSVHRVYVMTEAVREPSAIQSLLPFCSAIVFLGHRYGVFLAQGSGLFRALTTLGLSRFHRPIKKNHRYSVQELSQIHYIQEAAEVLAATEEHTAFHTHTLPDWWHYSRKSFFTSIYTIQSFSEFNIIIITTSKSILYEPKKSSNYAACFRRLNKQLYVQFQTFAFVLRLKQICIKWISLLTTWLIFTSTAKQN